MLHFYKAFKCPFYIGCYTDGLNGIRDLNGLGTTSMNQIGGGSVDSCVSYCSSQGFLYAGVEFELGEYFSIEIMFID